MIKSSMQKENINNLFETIDYLDPRGIEPLTQLKFDNLFETIDYYGPGRDRTFDRSDISRVLYHYATGPLDPFYLFRSLINN